MGEFAASVDRKGSQHVTLRPLDTVSNLYGSYRAQSSTGTMAAGLAAAAQIWQLRWAPTVANDICIVRRVVLEAVVLGTGFTAGTALFQLFASRANTAAGSGGGTLTLTTNNCKKRTSMATTKMSAIRTATTAALTAATETLDATPYGGILTEVLTTADIVLVAKKDGMLFEGFGDEYGIVLANQEGLVIKATVPATGTWRAAISVEWDEISKEKY